MSDDPTERWRELYETTGNVLYIWHALASAALDTSRPLPPWVAEYLRAAASALCRLKGDPKSRAGKVCDVFGIIRDNVNAFAELVKDNDAAWAALSSVHLGGGDHAAEIIAMEQGAKDVRDVDRIMQRVRRKVKLAKVNRRFT